MATSNKVNNLMSIIFISLAAMSPALLKADVADVWCKRTDDNSLCLSIVNSDKRADLKTSPNGIATILRDNAVATAIAASLKIAPLLGEAKEKHMVDALKTCSTDYFDTINTLKTADMKTITLRTYPTLAEVIKTGNNKADECERSFQNKPTIPSPLTADNVALKKISSTMLDLLQKIVICTEVAFC